MIYPRKRFGQHWLKDNAVLSKIMKSARLSSTDKVLEIGPGTGILTRRLLSEAFSVTAIEVDWDLYKQLEKKFYHRESLLLLQKDILKTDLSKEVSKYNHFWPINKVVANIPYNITSPILEKLLGSISNPNHSLYEIIVLLVQKEVAKRITALPGNKAYGSLSAKIQYLANCSYICDVSCKAFYPVPKVDSAVITLQPRVLNSALNPSHLESLINLGFSNRRKMLHNNLKNTINTKYLIEFLEKTNLNLKVRAENLSINQWIELSNHLYPLGNK